MATTDEKIKIVQNQAKDLTETLQEIEKLLLPTAKELLDAVRSIRMAFDREIIEITRSAKNITEMTKTIPELKEYTNQIIALDKALTPQLIEKIKPLVKE